MPVLCSLLLSVLRCCDWGRYGSVGKLPAQLFEVTGSKLSPAATHLALDQEAGARIPSILPARYELLLLSRMGCASPLL